jgi:hypothetical protein
LCSEHARRRRPEPRSQRAFVEFVRTLRLERLVGGGAHCTLSGRGLDRFRDLLAGETCRGAKEENRKRILAEIVKSASIHTVVKP